MDRDAGRRWRWAAGLAGAAAPVALAAYSAWVVRSAERAVPPDGRLIDVEGGALHVVDRAPSDGSGGPPIVLIHGLGGQLRNFTFSLAERLPGHRLIVVDRPGSGYSRADAGPRGVPAQAAMIASLIERMGLERPLIVGHSLGGMVALALALDHPERVGGLALVCPLTQPEARVSPVLAALVRAVPRGLRKPLAWTVGTPVGKAVRRRTMEQVFAPDPIPDGFRIAGGTLLASRPGSLEAGAVELAGVNAALAAMAPRYGSIGVPAAILYARHDRVLDPAIHGAPTAAAIPACDYRLVDAGHMVPVTRPAETAAVIRAVAARMAGAG